MRRAQLRRHNWCHLSHSCRQKSISDLLWQICTHRGLNQQCPYSSGGDRLSTPTSEHSLEHVTSSMLTASLEGRLHRKWNRKIPLMILPFCFGKHTNINRFPGLTPQPDAAGAQVSLLWRRLSAIWVIHVIISFSCVRIVLRAERIIFSHSPQLRGWDCGWQAGAGNWGAPLNITGL